MLLDLIILKIVMTEIQLLKMGVKQLAKKQQITLFVMVELEINHFVLSAYLSKMEYVLTCIP